MKVYAKSPAHLSRAMFRVDEALAKYAPPEIELVDCQADADFVVIPVIGYPETLEAAQGCIARGQGYAMIQYCLRTTQKPSTLDWLHLWQMADCVWSYYDIVKLINEDDPELDQDQRIPFYYAPLGVDEEFTKPYLNTHRSIGAMTSGYVSAPSAEAIEEVAVAAGRCGLTVTHIGPFPEGMTGDTSPGRFWRFLFAISDQELADAYRAAKWVSGLRHGEGFELPVLEGLCCGARPILFDRPEMRYWYGDHAVFVPECHGIELVERLEQIMSQPPAPVTKDERNAILHRFDWQPIVKGFWSYVLQAAQ